MLKKEIRDMVGYAIRAEMPLGTLIEHLREEYQKQHDEYIGHLTNLRAKSLREAERLEALIKAHINDDCETDPPAMLVKEEAPA